MGLTIVDSLDTMFLMGLHSELEVGEKWLQDHLFFNNNNHHVNLFECTIRVLGSLLSMHHFTRKSLYLERAEDLADRLLSAFTSPSAIPYATVELGNRKGIMSTLGQGESSTAEVATLQLEFRYLSYLTGKEKYKKAVDGVIQQMKKLDKYDGLVPIFIRYGMKYSFIHLFII